MIGQAVESSLCSSLAQVEPLTYLRPGKSLGAQRSNTGGINLGARPSELLPFGARIPQASTDPLADQVTLKLRDRRHDREQRLPEWRGDIDILAVRDELNAEGAKLFKCKQQMLCASRKRSNRQTSTQSNAAFGHHLNRSKAGRLCFAPENPVSTYSVAVSRRRGVLTEFGELQFGTLFVCANAGIDRNANGSGNLSGSHVASLLGDIG